MGLYPSHLSFSVDTASNTPFSEGKRGMEWKKSYVGSKIIRDSVLFSPLFPRIGRNIVEWFPV